MIMFDFVPAFKNADSTSFGQIFELPSHFALDLILWIHCCCGSTGSLAILQLYDYSIQYCPLQYPSAPPPGKILRKRLLVPTTPSAWIWLWSDVLSICHLPFFPSSACDENSIPFLKDMIWCSFACEVLGMTCYGYYAIPQSNPVVGMPWSSKLINRWWLVCFWCL